MAWPVAPIAFSGNTPQFQVSRSLRFDGTSSFLAGKNRFEGNRQKFTQSMWIKRARLDVPQWLSMNPSATYGAGLYITPDNRLWAFINYIESTNTWQGIITTQQPLRDPTSWYHINLAVDTTQALPQNRIKLSLNGSTVTSLITSYPGSAGILSYPALDTQTNFNTQFVSYDTNTPIGGPGFRYIGGWTGSQYFDGYMAEINYVDGQALDPIAFGRYDENGMWVPRRYNGNFGPNGYYLPLNDNSSRGALGLDGNQLNSADPFWPFTVFHLQTRTGIPFGNNNTFIDSSNTGATITRTGNASQGTFNPYSLFGSAAATRGGSVYFDGNSELNAGSNANFAFGSNSYTVEFWVYSTVNMNTYGAGTGPVFVCNDATNGWGIYNNNTAGQGITLFTRNVSNTYPSGVQLPFNRWNHIAVSRSAPAGNAFAIWLNGTRILNGGDSTNWSVTGPLKIGNFSTAGYNLRGYIAGLRILNNEALYDPASTTITVPTAPPENIGSSSTVFLLNANNAAVYDATGFHNLNTLNAAAASQAQTLYGGSSLFLDGSTVAACVSSNIYNNYLVNFAANDFTVESWVWLQVAPTGVAPTNTAFIASVHDNSGGSTWCMFVNPSRTVALFGSSGIGVDTVNSIPLQTWVHIAAVRNGDFVTMYLNGVADITTRVTGTFTAESIASLVIGRRYQGVSPNNVDAFNGHIYDLRITRAARYLGNFTPPAQALPTTGSTQGFWPYNIRLGGHKEMDSMLDVPANWGTDNGGILSGTMRGNYATINTINKGAGFVVSNGGLDVSKAAAGATWSSAAATHAVSSGKWYWEVLSTNCAGVGTMLGVANSRWDATADGGGATYTGGDAALNSWGYYTNGNVYRNAAATLYGASYATNDIIGFALDMDNGTFYASKNGVWQNGGNPSIGRNPINQISSRIFPLTTFHSPAFSIYSGDTYSVNFGQRPFVYADGPALSAGFKPICTSNLPIPSIRRPSNFFSATSYTGGTNTFNTDSNAGSLVLAMPLDSYNTYFDVSNEISSRISQPKALYTTAGVTYTSISGAAFNGTTGYIELSSHPDFDLGIAGNWTIEWYQFWNNLTGFQTVWNNNYATIPNLLIQSQNGLGRYQLYTNGGTPILNEGNAPTPDLWYHYAVVKNGTTYTIFRNGSATGVTTYNAVTNAGSSTFRPEIGRGSGAYFVNGNIRDFRIYKGWAKYTTTFNPATATTAVVATIGTGFDKSINLGFQPDLVWVKARNIGRTSHILVDSVRGGTSTLSANSTNIATISSNNVTFNQTGFTVGGSKEFISTTYPRTIYATGQNEPDPVGNAGSYGLLNLDPATSTSLVSTFTPILNQSISAINPYSPAYLHNVMIPLSGGTEWYWNGWSKDGAAGTGSFSNIFSSVWLPLSGNWDKVLVGDAYTFALSAGTQTKWYVTGSNTAGQFGNGTTTSTAYFTPLSGDWSEIVLSVYSTNIFSTVFALSAGTQSKWYVAGNNSAIVGSGKFGNGITTNSSWFIPLTGEWLRIKPTRNCTFALSTNGAWFATGRNTNGLFGNGTTVNRISFVPLSGNWSDIIPSLGITFALSAGTQTGWYAAGSGDMFGDPTIINSTWYIPVSGGPWGAVKLARSSAFALNAITNKWFYSGTNGNVGVTAPAGTGSTNAGLNTWAPVTQYTQLSTTIGGDFNDLSVNDQYTFAFRPSSFSTGIGNKIINQNLNTPGATYTAYGWKRNILAGFDIVRFNKTSATNESFSHGLGKPPSMMIVKGVTFASGWNVYHAFASATTPAGVYLALETNQAAIPVTTMWNSTQPTAAQFSLGTAWSGGNYIAYLFAEIPGFSQFGTYTGTGVADGPFIWTGFKPKFVMTKRTDAVSDWLIWDSSRGPINPISPHFTVNSAQQDNSIVSPTYTGYIDFVSTGFKMRLTSEPNTSTARYIYAAFAEEPFGRTPSQTTAK